MAHYKIAEDPSTILNSDLGSNEHHSTSSDRSASTVGNTDTQGSSASDTESNSKVDVDIPANDDEDGESVPEEPTEALASDISDDGLGFCLEDPGFEEEEVLDRHLTLEELYEDLAILMGPGQEEELWNLRERFFFVYCRFLLT